MRERSHHDMGGLTAGSVERIEHDYADWERRTDAMMVLLWGITGTRKRLTMDEHRKAVEALSPAAYDAMSYYEKWIYAMAHCLVARGVITSHELARKMLEVERRG